MGVGLFSVPAPPTRNPCVRRGFFVQMGASESTDRCPMWRIEGSHASLSTPRLSARVSLRQPEPGLGDIERLQSALPDARLLQLQLSDAGAGQRLVEAYVRGSDLVASYEAASGRASATQVYWRYVEHAELGAAGVELIVSVRTESSDADPSLTVGSELACRELIQAAAPDATSFQPIPVSAKMADQLFRLAGVGLFVRRLTGDAVSYVEMVHPADFSSVEFAVGGGPAGCIRSRFGLFEERLEKGVIRRARARGLLCRREGDEAVARECYLRLLASEAPLTA